MADRARVREAASTRRDAILDAVAFTAERMLLSPDWKGATDEALARLGIAAGVSRAFIEANEDRDGRIVVNMVTQWVAPGVTAHFDDPALRDFDWVEGGYGRWVDLMLRGEAIHGPVSSMPEQERPILEAQGIRSLISFPVYVDGRWWGAIGFDDFETDREWSGAEIDALRAAAGVLGAAIQRHRSDRQAIEAESRYHEFVERIPAITYTDIPEDGEVRMGFVSPQVEETLGYQPERFLQDHRFWRSLIHRDDYSRLRAPNAFDPSAAQTFDEEYRMTAADGREVWVHDTSTPIHDDEGRLLYWQGFAVDITARKCAEGQLRQAEERFRALVEHIPAVVYAGAIVPDGDSLYISPQVEALFGHTPADWKAHRDFWRDHVHPDDLQKTLALNEQADRSGGPLQAEYRFRTSDGRWVWIRDEATLVEMPGSEGYWQGFLIDITERKRAEEQLREAEEKFRTMVEQNPAVTYTQQIDPETGASVTTYISPRNIELTGYTLEETLADEKLWTNIVHPDDRERVLAADRATNETGEAFSMEFRIVAKDGRVVWVHDEATLVRVGNGRPFWQGFMADITERKRSEEQLERALAVEREATQRLRALDEMKNTFLQAVSHDLRTPLAAILGLAVTLERGDVQLEPHDSRDLARRIAENARKLDRLVTNLLDLDRLGRGIIAPKLQRTDVGALVRRLLAGSDLIAGNRLHTDIEPVAIGIDAAKVERIVENLLANTARHTPANAQIWVSVQPRDGGALIMVEDDGPGVAAELHETIFEPFRQGPDAPQHSPGVGVGLTLVKRFAELHRGRAWVEGRPGGGASFRVWLPNGEPDTA